MEVWKLKSEYMNNCVVYKIVNNTNNKIYIGLTNNFRRRMNEHFSNSSNPDSNKFHRYFYLAIRKYGWENFTKEILEEGLTREEANEREKYYIKKFNSNNRTCGYNLEEGGNNSQITAELTQIEVDEIIKIIQETTRYFDDIGKQFGVSPSAISGINTGRNWYNKDMKYPLRSAHLTDELKVNIAKDLEGRELKIFEIAEKYGVTFSTVQRLNQGKTYPGFWSSYPIRKKRVK